MEIIMTDKNIDKRPIFPKRAIVTAGMPYGNKNLHFGHIGGVFVPADIFARFLRDRIGPENVIFISGTDCYGSAIEISFTNEVNHSKFSGNIFDYILRNHNAQKKALNEFQISLDFFGASAIGEAAKIHKELSQSIFDVLYQKNFLKLESNYQYYDEKFDTFLNGRQVVGHCPIQGCKSEIAYADECSLGHQYNPSELINPISILSGETPKQVPVKNWYFDLPSFSKFIKEHISEIENDDRTREVLARIINDYLKKPSIYIKKDLYYEIKDIHLLPEHIINEEEGKQSLCIIFNTLKEREKAVRFFDDLKIRYRTGKTVVPLRISGNVNWGIPVPVKDGINNLTFWVWPESLWAPISFTKYFLKENKNDNDWEKWWKCKDSNIYQFIGEDNIYFYGIAETGLFHAIDKNLNLPIIVPNHHLLYGNAKASSSSENKPPTAEELLSYYTPEQLRLHFMNMNLGKRSVNFTPKAALGTDGFDDVLHEGNLLTNIFNRLVRSGFYTVQKYNNGIYPLGNVSPIIKLKSDDVIYKYESYMATFSFNKIYELLNKYLRESNKYWAEKSRDACIDNILQLLIDIFHIVRVATTLFHPIAPYGCEMIRDYLGVDDRIWNWKYIFESLDYFIDKNHSFKPLPPHTDFFQKHNSQLKAKD